MKTGTHGSRMQSERGTVVILVALLMVVFLGIAALAVDVGYMVVARNESQNTADAAALAGARMLGENYYNKATPVTTDVTTRAQGTAVLNTVAAQNIATDNAITQIGVWDGSTKTFTATTVNPNAVQVEVKRELGLTNGPINTFFAPILGANTVNSQAIACAALSGECKAVLGLPLGIGKSWFTNTGANNGCTTIKVNDTNKSCAGWTNLSTAKFKWKDVDDMIVDPTKIPTTLKIGDMVEFGGGTINPMVKDLADLFNKMKTGTPPTWTTSVVVYDDKDTCTNPNTPYPIIGYATITVTAVDPTGKQGLEGYVDCNLASQTRGGCFYAGTYGTIPGLVK
jgi:hypothetical protein